MDYVQARKAAPEQRHCGSELCAATHLVLPRAAPLKHKCPFWPPHAQPRGHCGTCCKEKCCSLAALGAASIHVAALPGWQMDREAGRHRVSQSSLYFSASLTQALQEDEGKLVDQSRACFSHSQWKDLQGIFFFNHVTDGVPGARCTAQPCSSASPIPGSPALPMATSCSSSEKHCGEMKLVSKASILLRAHNAR